MKAIEEIRTTVFRYLKCLLPLMMTVPSAALAMDKIDCASSMISMDAPAFAQPDLRCWRNIRGDYVYDFVYAERAGKNYSFIGLSNAKEDEFMNFEPDVKTIVKSLAPKTYDKSRDWSENREIETKYIIKATFSEFHASGWNCFGFVQYISPKATGFKFLLSGINCRARRNGVNPQDVAKFINQFEFSE